MNKQTHAKPFFKWVGGKRQIADKILDNFPSELNTYYEPFVGGGAMLFKVLEKYPKLKRVVINDLNADVAYVYKCVKDNLDNLISSLHVIENEYNTSDDKRMYYYNKRDEYNKFISNSIININRAALFLFLNKTCFNGMYRVNKVGLFNTPYNFANEIRFDYDNLKECSNALQKVEICNGDYSNALPKRAIKNALVYFDPPYRPLFGLGEINYTADGFNDTEQERLKISIDSLNNKDIKIILSNSDTKDEYFDNLYKDYKILRVQARRSINANGNGRGKIDELLIKNF